MKLKIHRRIDNCIHCEYLEITGKIDIVHRCKLNGKPVYYPIFTQDWCPIKEKLVKNKEKCPKCAEEVENVEVYGCWICGYNH